MNINIDFNAIISFLSSSEVQERLFSVRIGFLAVAFILLALIIFVLLRTQWLRALCLESFVEFFTYRPYGAKGIKKPWVRIMGRLDSALESEYKLAVIEADNMLDHTLRRMGYLGKNLEERLKHLTSATLSNIDQIYEAHKIRDSIVHDPDYRLSLDKTREVLKIYEQACRDLQILT